MKKNSEKVLTRGAYNIILVCITSLTTQTNGKIKMTLQLKSAIEVYELVARKEIDRDAALEYARNKRELLIAKNKNRRALLWSKCIEKIEAGQDNIIGAVNNIPCEAINNIPHEEVDNNIPMHLRPDFVRMTPEEKLARGMVMKKVDGCKMYVWPTVYHNLTAQGYKLSRAKQALGEALWV